jgi:hypothetical protein
VISFGFPWRRRERCDTSSWVNVRPFFTGMRCLTAFGSNASAFMLALLQASSAKRVPISPDAPPQATARATRRLRRPAPRVDAIPWRASPGSEAPTISLRCALRQLASGRKPAALLRQSGVSSNIICCALAPSSAPKEEASRCRSVLPQRRLLSTKVTRDDQNTGSLR